LDRTYSAARFGWNSVQSCNSKKLLGVARDFSRVVAVFTFTAREEESFQPKLLLSMVFGSVTHSSNTVENDASFSPDLEWNTYIGEWKIELNKQKQLMLVAVVYIFWSVDLFSVVMVLKISLKTRKNKKKS
jgi:hypothetical protein